MSDAENLVRKFHAECKDQVPPDEPFPEWDEIPARERDIVIEALQRMLNQGVIAVPQTKMQNEFRKSGW